MAFTFDANNNLNVNVQVGGGGGGSNPAAGPTGSPVPADASYTGFNSSGNLVGASTANPFPVAQQGNVTVVGTGTLAVQATLPAGQAVELLDSGGTNKASIDATGDLQVDVNNFPATQAVSGTVTANQGGAPWTVKPDGTVWTLTGTSANVDVTNSVTVAQATAANLNATVTGTVSVNALPTGTNTIGKVDILGNAGATLDATVGAGTAPTNGIDTLGIYTQGGIAPTTGQSASVQIDQAGNARTFSGIVTKTLAAQGTAVNSTQTIINAGDSGALAVLVQLTQTTTLTAGAVEFQVSYDNVNWALLPATAIVDPTSVFFSTIAMPYTVQASTNKQFLVIMNGAQALRIITTTAITGTGTVTPNYTLLNYNPALLLGNQQVNLAQINGNAASTVGTGTLKVGVVGASGAIFDAGIGAGNAPANQIVTGTVYNSTAPSMVTGFSVAEQSDSSGSQFVNTSRRSSSVVQATTISATGATTILAAGATSHFRDITDLVISVTPQATTASSFTATLSDGTNSFIFDLIAPVTTATPKNPFVINFHTPLKATSTATAWTLNLSATNTVHVTVTAIDQLAS